MWCLNEEEKKFLEQQWNEAVWSFIHLLNFREKSVLIEWCAFSSATHAEDFYYIVVDFLRGNFNVKRKKTNFERLWNHDFLFDDVVVKNLSTSDDGFSNDIIDVILTCIMWGWDD